MPSACHQKILHRAVLYHSLMVSSHLLYGMKNLKWSERTVLYICTTGSDKLSQLCTKHINTVLCTLKFKVSELT